MMDDYAFECSMCGKPMAYRYCGMCVSCEQIDNDVPDDGFETSIGDMCPECGNRVTTRVMWHDDDCAEYLDKCRSCGYIGLPYVDC